MKDLLNKIRSNFFDLARRDNGQDMIEYAMVVALLSLAATAGMDSLAGGINTAFGTVSRTLAANVSCILF